MNDLSCGIRMWAQFSFVLSQCTHLTDRQTDRQTDGRTDKKALQYRALHYMQSHGKNVLKLKTTAGGKGGLKCNASLIATFSSFIFTSYYTFYTVPMCYYTVIAIQRHQTACVNNLLNIVTSWHRSHKSNRKPVSLAVLAP